MSPPNPSSSSSAPPQSESSSPSSIGIYTLTFNCGRELLPPQRLAPHLFAALPTSNTSSRHQHPELHPHDAYLAQLGKRGKKKRKASEAPHLLVLALQEVAPIPYAFLGGGFLRDYLERFRKAVDDAAAAVFDSSDGGQQEGEGEMVGYHLAASRNVGMTALLVFVRRDYVGKVNVNGFAGVGVGWWGMGNKGAVGVRLGINIAGEEAEAGSDEGEILDLAITSAHLAPVEDALEKRNQDWRDIVQGMVFESDEKGLERKRRQRLKDGPSGQEEEAQPLLDDEGTDVEGAGIGNGIYSPRSHFILAGDLNYRTSIAGPMPDEYRMFPQPCEDESYPTHYWHLLNSDQLTQELKAGRTLQGLTEAPVDFPPTYKYSDRARRDAVNDRGDMDADGKYWDWAKHRWPSWCDRVLYLDLPSWMKASHRDAKITVQGYMALPLLPSSDHRPVACSLTIPAQPIPKPTRPETVIDGGITGGGELKEDAMRLKPPFDLDATWKARRAAARRREVVVGLGAYLTMTWEGRGILLALVCGALGGWAVVQRMIEQP